MAIHIKEPIERAGGVAAIASLFNISPVSVYEWISRGCVPADKCPEIEKFSSGSVRCEELNDKVDWAYLRAAATPTPPDALPYTTPNGGKLRESKGGARQPVDPNNLK